MRTNFKNFLKIDEASSFLPGGRTTGLPLDSPTPQWDFPDMLEPVTMMPTSPSGEQIPTDFKGFSQLKVRRELMMKLNTYQRMANVVKSLVAYKLDPSDATDVHTGKTIVSLDYKILPSLKDATAQNGKIIGVDKSDILSSGLQTHGMQINSAEIGMLEAAGVISDSIQDPEKKYDINITALYENMVELKRKYQNIMKMGYGADAIFDKAASLINSPGKLQLSKSVTGG